MAGAQALDSIAQHRSSAGSVARVTADSLQIGAEARGLGTGALGLARQRGDVAGVLGGGLGQRSGIRLGGAGCRRGIQAGSVTLRSEVPGGQRRHGNGRRETDRQGVPAKQREDRGAGHGYAVRSSSKCGPSLKDAQSPPQTIGTTSSFAAAFIAAPICS